MRIGIVIRALALNFLLLPASFVGVPTIAVAQQGVVGVPPFSGCATWVSTNILTGTGIACGTAGSIVPGTTAVVCSNLGSYLYGGTLLQCGDIVRASDGVTTFRNGAGTNTFNLTAGAAGLATFSGSLRIAGSGTITSFGPGGVLGNLAFTVPGTGVATAAAIAVNTSGGFATYPVSGAGVSLTVGSSLITGGTNPRILYDNSGVLGEYTLTGSGTVAVMQTSPSLITPALGVATGTSLVLNGGQALSGSIVASIEGQALASGATGTSAGWYAQMDGSSVPCMRIGLNANDVPSLAFGSCSATRDLFLERLGAASLRLGTADAAAPVAQTVSVQGVIAGTTNTAGANWTFAASPGTGTGAGGSIIWQVAAAGSTGTAQNALATGMTLSSVGGGNLSTAGSIASGTTLTAGTSVIATLTVFLGSGSTRLTNGGNGLPIIQNNAATSGVGLDVNTDAVLKIRTRAQTGDAAITASNGTFSGQLNVTTMTQTAVAQSGTMCYNSGTGAITYDATLGCLASLEELKNILGPIVDAKSEVMALKPIWFSPINRPIGSDLAEQPGFGAHQVEAVDKRLVGYDADGNLRGVRYMEMTALLTAHLQELQREVDSMRSARK